MALTKLDERAALIVIDLQKGILAIPAAHSASEVVGRAAELARAFRERGWPVVLVNVVSPAPGRTDMGRRKFDFGEGWTALAPELEASAGDILVSKRAPGAFLGTALDAELKARGVTQVFAIGIATNAGVEATARSAYDLGYNVVLVVDAMTTQHMEVHRWCVERVFPRIAETTTTVEVLVKMAGAGG